MSVRKHDVEAHERDEAIGRAAYAQAVRNLPGREPSSPDGLVACLSCRRRVAPKASDAYSLVAHNCEHGAPCHATGHGATLTCYFCEAVRDPVATARASEPLDDFDEHNARSINRKLAALTVALSLEHTPYGLPWTDDYRAAMTDWLNGEGPDLGETIARADGVLLGLSLAGVLPDDPRVLRATLRYVAADAAWWSSRPSTVPADKVPGLAAKARALVAQIGNRA